MRTGSSFGQGFPRAYYDNDVSKNTATGGRFKDVGRILKRLRYKVNGEKIAAAGMGLLESEFFERWEENGFSLSPRLRGSIVILLQMRGTYVRQRTPRRERADQCG